MSDNHPIVQGTIFARLAVFAITLMAAGSAHSAAEIVEIGYALHRLGPVGAQGWGSVDADGDGRIDLVTTADGPAALILVYGRAGSTFAPRLKQSIVRPPDSIAALSTIPGNGAKVVVVGSDQIATLYGGWPLAAQGTFAIQHATRIARAGDIDADGNTELLCAGANAVTAYSLPDGNLEWSVSLSAADFMLASIDSDPALELVIAQGDAAPGMVLDGATLLQEWVWPAGFGSHVASGRFGDFLEPEIIGAKAFGPVSGFSVAPYAPAWTINNSDTDAVAAGDTDADGRDEFAIGDGQWGSVRVHDGPTRQLLYQFANQDHGMWALGFLDVDGDLRSEVWYSARIENSSNRDPNFAAAIMNPITALPRLVIDSYWQSASASAFADLDGDGGLEWIIGTSGPSNRKGLLRVLDAATLQEDWRAPYTASTQFDMVYRSLHVAPFVSEARPKLIAVGGAPSYGFRFLVINGDNHQIESQVPPGFPQEIRDEMTASRLVQHVPGGNPELLVFSHANGIGFPSVQLDVYSLPEGNLVWSSPVLGGDYDRSLSLDVGQLDADPATEYLATYTAGMIAYDSVTGAMEWTLPVTVQGAIILEGDDGPRIYTHTESGSVAVLDAATQASITSFALPAPLERLARLPGRSDYLLAVAGERLLLIRATDGELVAQSDWIAGKPAPGDNLAVVREGNRWRVSTGRSFATYQHWVSDPDVLFDSSFE